MWTSEGTHSRRGTKINPPSRAISTIDVVYCTQLHALYFEVAHNIQRAAERQIPDEEGAGQAECGTLTEVFCTLIW